jgi:hypothetical protein
MNTAVAIKRTEVEDEHKMYGPTNVLTKKLQALSPSEAYLRGREAGHQGQRVHADWLVSTGKVADSSAFRRYRHAGFVAIELIRSHNEIDALVVAEYRRGWLEGSQTVRPSR